MGTFARLRSYGKVEKVSDIETTETNPDRLFEQIGTPENGLPNSVQFIIKEGGQERNVSGLFYLNGVELDYAYIEANMSDQPQFIAQLVAQNVNRLVWLGSGVWKKLEPDDRVIEI